MYSTLKKSISLKAISILLIMSFFVSFGTPSASAQIETFQQKEVELQSLVEIPKIVNNLNTFSDISLVDWEKEVQFGARKIPLNSDVVLNALNIDPKIKEVIRAYRDEVRDVDDTFLMLPSTKESKKNSTKEGLQYSIANILVEIGQLPEDYLEMKTVGNTGGSEIDLSNLNTDYSNFFNDANVVEIPNAEIIEVSTVNKEGIAEVSEISLYKKITNTIGSLLPSNWIRTEPAEVTNKSGQLIGSTKEAIAWQSFHSERVSALEKMTNLPPETLESARYAKDKFDTYLFDKGYTETKGGTVEVSSSETTLNFIQKKFKEIVQTFLPERVYAYVFGTEDFESCSLLPCSFDNDVSWGSVTASLDVTSKVNGVDSLKQVVIGEGGGSLEKVNINEDEVWVQFKTFIPSNIAWGGSGFYSLFGIEDSNNDLLFWLNLEDWGTARLTFGGDSNGLSWTDSGLDLTKGAVNTIEVRYKNGTTTGDIDIWVNNTTQGSPSYNGSGSLNTGTANADDVLIGLVYAPETGISTTYFDDAVVNNSFIGNLTTGTTSNTAPTSPSELKVEGITNPTDVTDMTPEFSAIYNDPDTSDVSNRYHIQVSSTSTFSSVFWDSGTSTMATTTFGSRSPQISYSGSDLATSTTYYWRIKFIDENGLDSTWSTTTSSFTMGEVSGTDAITASALNYLLENQNLDGSWGNTTSTIFINTVAAIEALYSYDETGTSYQNGLDWIYNYIAENNDYLSEQLEILAISDMGTTTANLLTNGFNKSSGGFMFNEGYEADTITTSKAVQALFKADYEDPGDTPSMTEATAIHYLINTQGSDDGWSVSNSGVSTIPATTEVIKALLLYKHQTLALSEIKIDDTLNPAIESLVTAQMSNGTWGNSTLDTALAFYVIRLANENPTYREDTLQYFENEQEVDGSFADDIYVTAKVLEALSISGAVFGELETVDIVPISTLQTGTTTQFKIQITNNGDVAVDKGLLHIMADDYHLQSFDFETYNIVINPAETQEITVGISDTRNYLGNVTFKVFVEGTDDIIHPDSLYQETLTYNPDPANRPAIPLYFVAYKGVSSGGNPAIKYQWPVKNDPNLKSYVLMYRQLGTSTWSGVTIASTTSGSVTLSGGAIQEGITYEASVGTFSQLDTLYYHTPVQVKVSSSSSLYIDGTVSGTVIGLDGTIPEVDVLGVNASTTAIANEEGEYMQEHVPWGSGYARVSNFLYEGYTRKYINSDDALTDINVYTNRKVDTQNPTVGSVSIVGESDHEMENLETKLIQYSVDDDIGIGNDGIVQSASFYYYDPGDENWHLIGTKSGYLISTLTYEWNIPGNLVGDGFKIKVIVRDFAGKDSTAAEWDTFELTAGNASPEFDFTAPSISGSEEADENYLIKWTDEDIDDNATTTLSYDIDQNPNNSNHVTITEVMENDPLDQYEWNTSGITNGSYYIRADVTDGNNTNVQVYSDQAVDITHNRPLPPSDLLVEGQTNPIDIVDNTPEFSAIYNDPDLEALATHYKIQVATTSVFTNIYWDSGSTTLASSTSEGNHIGDVSYSGTTLASSTNYYWRIKFWNDSGFEGDWSTTTASFNLSSSTGSSTNYMLYGESVAPGWADWSWNITLNPSNTSPVHSGTYSLLASYTAAWGGLSYHSNSFNSTPYDTLRLRLNVGTSTAVDLYAYFTDENGAVIDVIELKDYVAGGFVANTWHTIVIPLTHLDFVGYNNATNFNVEASQAVTIYYDNIEFIDI